NHRRAALAAVGAHGLAGGQADRPVVQRAGHRMALDDPLAQGACLVRALVLEREDLAVARAEDGDVALRARDAARTAQGNIAHRADVGPQAGGFHMSVHAGANSRRRVSGLNSWESRPATRSAQGSTRENRWE